MAAGLAVIIIGADREPSTSLVEAVGRFDYEPALIAWPASQVKWNGAPPLAVMVDFRVLGVDARAACRAARENRSFRAAPLIAVVAEQEAPRLDLSLGFDDLLLSPYRLSELAARLRLIRWRAEIDAAPAVLRAGALAIDEVSYQVRIERRPVELTLKEYQLLLFLMKNAGRVLTREELLGWVWGHDYFGGTRTVDVHIRRLRAKTAEAGDLIETVRGVGYRLSVPDP